MKRIEYYRSETEKEPCREWLQSLNPQIQNRVRGYIERVAAGGGKSNVRALGGGVFEIKVDHGPSYRVYFGQIGNVVILLLVGGDKGTQFREMGLCVEIARITKT